MAGKPFSIQSPQDVAKEYGGNKQKIAHAVQAGLIDPTSGVLAGMFIDRMRNAQMQEQAQAPSVAQQVMAPPRPAMPPGMGAPPAMPPGAGAPPAMGAPHAPGMAEGGYVPPYASGGLDGLPVPDTMFDESRNGGFDDGYAGGGIVAFASGGDSYEDVPFDTGPGDQTDWRFGPTMGRFGRGIADALAGWDKSAANKRANLANEGVIYQNGKYYSRQGFGVQPAVGAKVLDVASGKYFTVPGTDQRAAIKAPSVARAAAPQPATAPPAGLADHMQPGWQDRIGPQAMAALLGQPAAPTAGVPRQAAPGLPGVSRAPAAAAAAPPADTMPATPAPAMPASLADYLKGVDTAEAGIQDKIGGLNTPGSAFAEQMDALKKLRDPTEQAKRKKEDMWMALAQIGAGMAASKSPYFLQAAGEAAQGALPGIAASAKERRQDQKDALKQAVDMQLAEFNVKTKNYEAAVSITDTYNKLVSEGLGREQAMKIAVMQNETNLKELKSRERIAGMQVAATRDQTAATRDATRQTRQDAQYFAAEKFASQEADKAILGMPGAGMPNPTPKQKAAMQERWDQVHDARLKALRPKVYNWDSL